MPVRWWHPTLAGFVASLQWSVAFFAVDRGAFWCNIAAIAAIGVFATAAVARNGGSSLKVRGRLWLGAAMFGLGHIPALGLAHWYIWKTAAPAYPLLLLYLAAFPALIAYLASRVNARWPRIPAFVTVPLLWVALEYVRGEWLIGGYPWYLLGHALTRNDGPAWPAHLIGAYGCSLLLAFPACFMLHVLDKFKSDNRAAGVFGAIGGLSPLLLVVLLPSQAAPTPVRTLRVAILQTNLPQDNKIGWALADRISMQRHWLALCEQAAGKLPRPQLIVWPETMFPGYALNPEAIEAQRRAGLTYSAASSGGQPLPATWFADSLIEAQTRCNIPFLVGAIATDGLRYSQGDGGIKTTLDARTNSAVLVTNGSIQSERYDKVDLMAFGEYIPVVYRWPNVQSWLTGLGAQGMAFDLAFGTRRTLFDIEGVRTGTPICFEVCHEAACREFTTTADGHRRADLLINITNDGWFYGSDFNRRMHLLQARWRCAELATPMARAANTGISCVIDSAGKVLTTTLDDGAPLTQTEGLVTADIPLVDPQSSPTFYATTGHYLNNAIVAAGGLLAVLAFWPGRRTKPAPAA